MREKVYPLLLLSSHHHMLLLPQLYISTLHNQKLLFVNLLMSLLVLYVFCHSSLYFWIMCYNIILQWPRLQTTPSYSPFTRKA